MTLKFKPLLSTFTFFVLVLLFIFWQGCASGRRTQSIQAEMSDLHRELNAIKEENFNLQREITKLHKKLEEYEKAQRQNKADFSTQIEELRNQIEMLRNQLEESNYRINRLSEKVGVFEYPASPSGTQTTQVDSVKKSRSTAANIDMGEARELYNTAYSDLIRGNYQLALHGFQQFLKLYPNSELADNAQYWIGEIYYAQGRYNDAVAEFEKVIKNYPNGDKIPASMLKIGYSYINMKELEQGKFYLEEVINQYPDSHEAKLAQGRLQALK